MFCAGLVIAAFAACGNVINLNVGDLAPQADDGGPRDEATLAESSVTTSLLDVLTARCAAASGSPSYYTNAAELTTHLKGRWYYCPSLGNWQLPPGTGLELDFTSTGSWAFLTMTAAGDGFTASSDPDHSGQILYYIPPQVILTEGGVVTVEAGPEGGGTDGGSGATDGATADGSSPNQGFIPVDDTATLNGIEVFFTRADFDDFHFIIDFEASPQKMVFQEVGVDPVHAVFVPID